MLIEREDQRPRFRTSHKSKQVTLQPSWLTVTGLHSGLATTCWVAAHYFISFEASIAHLSLAKGIFVLVALKQKGNSSNTMLVSLPKTCRPILPSGKNRTSLQHVICDAPAPVSMSPMRVSTLLVLRVTGKAFQ